VDLYSPTSKDSTELKKIRDEQYLYLSEWVDEYWREVKAKTLPTSINIVAEEQ